MLKRRIKVIAFAAAALAAASVVSVPAGAGFAAPKDCLKTVTVTNPGDDGSDGQLRTAIAQVCNGGTITVDPSVPSPIEAWRFTIDKNIKLYGAGQTLFGSGFDVTTAGTLIMSGLDLDVGGGGHPAFDVQGVLVVKDATITHFLNAVTANPGSKVVLGKGTLVTGNISDRREGGAGIYNDRGAVTLTDDATVTENLAYGCFTAPGIPPMGWGAGVFSKGGSITLDKYAVVSNNRGRYCDPSRGDGGAGTGGGIFMVNGAVTLSGHARVSGNIAGSGAGIAVWDGSVTLNDDVTVTGNQSTGGGGGVTLSRATLTMNGASTIAGNTSVSNGGGVTNASGLVTLNDTASITGNTVGGIYNVWSFTDPPRLFVNDQATITGNTPYDVYPANSAAPVAVDDRYALDTTGGTATLTVAAAQGVLANDTDPDATWLAASLVAGPTHGTLTGGALAWNGSFAYTPEPGFSGVDTFTYKALDPSFESNLATVQIIVDVFCNGQLATIVGSGTITGTSGDDVIVGSAGPDTINGLGGNDTICALAGDDSITGGEGVDVIDGGDGTDTLVESGATFTLTDTSLTRMDVGVGTSTDTLAGIEQATLTGSGLNDTLNASGFSGPVTLDGLAGNDILTGSPVGDTLTGGPGLDTISGGSGIDTIIEARDASMTLTNTRLTIGTEGNDTLGSIEQAILTGGTSANTLTASSFSGQVRLYGVDGNDTITGGTGNDTLYGGDGDDTLNGGPGDDTIYGGPGSDTCVPSTGADLVYECEL